MGWLDNLRGELVYVDTAPLIYFIEENKTYLSTLRPFFELLDREEINAVTSTITLLEVLVQPFRQSNTQIASQYRDLILNSRGLSTVSLTPEIAELAANLRAKHSLRTPDVIQLATALHSNAKHFLTNDISLRTTAKSNKINILILDELVNQ